MKRLTGVLLLVALTAMLLGAEKKGDRKGEKKKPKKFQATCPVQGEPAEKDSVILFKGKPLYFCCMSCPDVFDGTPSIYLSKVHRQWLQTGEIAQVACPLKGHVLDPDLAVAVTVGGVKLKVCCPGCAKKLKTLKGDKKIDAVFASLTKGFTLQSKCPVSGKPIDAAQVVTYQKQKVYFCCPKCKKPFTASPKKYLAKLPQLRVKKKK